MKKPESVPGHELAVGDDVILGGKLWWGGGRESKWASMVMKEIQARLCVSLPRKGVPAVSEAIEAGVE